MTPLADLRPGDFPLAQLVADVGDLVRSESPSDDRDALGRAAAVVASLGERRLGVAPQRTEIDGRAHLRWEFGAPDDPRRLLVLGHYDTVWPVGTLDLIPWSVSGPDDDLVLRGPGCFDMKTGLVQAFHAIARAGTDRPVTLVITADEEIGSPTSRDLIEDLARRSAAALVLEASADGGALKSARKGVSMYEVAVTGRAAHAGLEPHKGVNATVELAHQVLRIAGLGDPDAGTTVVPTVASSGTTVNTVPAAGRVAVDVRAWTLAEQESVDRRMREATACCPGAEVVVTGGPNRPPVELRLSQGLVDRAVRLHQALGLGPLDHVAVGGASDGNFTAGVGTPTLDGLGAVGGGAHSASEHVLARYLPGRTALLAALIAELTA